MLLQRRDASAPRFGRAAARLPKALDPDNRRAGTDLKLLRRLASRSSAFDLQNHAFAHVSRIGLRHCPASQKRINADRLSHPSPRENPPDSIGAEHALAYHLGIFGFYSARNGPIGGYGSRKKKRQSRRVLKKREQQNHRVANRLVAKLSPSCPRFQAPFSLATGGTSRPALRDEFLIVSRPPSLASRS